jgi:hypothetical protein
MGGEEPTLFHILKMVKRRESRAIRHVQDQQGNIVTRHPDVLNTFVTHLRQKYGPIAIESSCVAKMRNAIQPTCPSKYTDQLEHPITSGEILSALRAGARHKAPGIDGFGLQFYTANWQTIYPDFLELLNQMFLHKKITPRQKHGIIVCLSKSNGDRTPEGYRPISLLTTEYKF